MQTQVTKFVKVIVEHLLIQSKAPTSSARVLVRADEWERAKREAPGEEKRVEQAPAGDQRGGRVERPEVLARERHALQAVGEQRRPRAALHQTLHRVRR